MIRARVSVVASAAVAMVLLCAANGASQPASPSPHPGLELLKSLQGEWAGPATWDQGGKKGGVEFKLSYRVTSGGSVVVETMFPGTSGEMITVYYTDGADLVLTHYCTSRNQPRMVLAHSQDPKDLAFRCTGGTNMKEDDSHMHSARITLVDADHIKGAWSSVKDGQVKWVAEARLERQKPAGPER